LLTGVGKRYDIVSAFAQHATVVAADPNPLAPAQYAAHHRVAVPRIADPDYVPALQELCEEHNVGAVIPLTDLDIEVLAHARVVESLGVRGPCTVQVFRDREIGLGITDVNTRFGGAFPGPMYAARPGHTYPELIARMARGELIEPHVGDFRARVTFTRYFWQL